MVAATRDPLAVTRPPKKDDGFLPPTMEAPRMSGGQGECGCPAGPPGPRGKRGRKAKLGRVGPPGIPGTKGQAGFPVGTSGT